MIDLRIHYRKKGLSDVFVRHTSPPVRAGIMKALELYRKFCLDGIIPDQEVPGNE